MTSAMLREKLGYLAYLMQENKLDAATPGKTAADRLVRNSQLAFDTLEVMVRYWNWDMHELIKEALNGTEAHEHYKQRIAKSTGRKHRN
jgi:hypothetical protein